MKVSEIMTTGVATVMPEASLGEAVKLMLDRRISGLPVVDGKGNIAGILTEGDLLRRAELGTERHRPRWIEFFSSTGKLAQDYVSSHARKVGEIMTPDVVTVADDAPIGEAVALMEKKRIKRIPVTSQGRLVGIVSRADLLHALASLTETTAPETAGDATIRNRIRLAAARENWVPKSVKFIVRNGVVELRGVLFDDRCRGALRVLAENVPGVAEVRDHMIWVEPMTGIAMTDPTEASGKGGRSAGA
ncbi:MAG TPA: CBS domain-containing protein [Stellaceae bacterium]|nr:CBS domain-containing protein [Stellaceae bacterium]